MALLWRSPVNSPKFLETLLFTAWLYKDRYNFYHTPGRLLHLTLMIASRIPAKFSALLQRVALFYHSAIGDASLFSAILNANFQPPMRGRYSQSRKTVKKSRTTALLTEDSALSYAVDKLGCVIAGRLESAKSVPRVPKPESRSPPGH